ncbi:MAG TPA: helix-hairpin-helix domain-containing protein, partial [Puia sp.]|nr:helix-hairpin-helix domain-containing protein [Puia sp.]
YWQELDERQKHPINLNTAQEDELRSLQILTDLQIYNFLQYRKLMGSFINIYELQAIPTWDLQSIKVLLPYV